MTPETFIYEGETRNKVFEVHALEDFDPLVETDTFLSTQQMNLCSVVKDEVVANGLPVKIGYLKLLAEKASGACVLEAIKSIGASRPSLLSACCIYEKYLSKFATSAILMVKTTNGPLPYVKEGFLQIFSAGDDLACKDVIFTKRTEKKDMTDQTSTHILERGCVIPIVWY